MNPAESLQRKVKSARRTLNVKFLKENKVAGDTLPFTIDLLLLTGEGDTNPRRIITKHMVFWTNAPGD